MITVKPMKGWKGLQKHFLSPRPQSVNSQPDKWNRGMKFSGVLLSKDSSHCKHPCKNDVKVRAGILQEAVVLINVSLRTSTTEPTKCYKQTTHLTI